MKKKMSNLDEMQEQALLQVEHNGCWLAFWGLQAAMAVQIIAFRELDFKTLAGEWIVFMALAIYLAVGCIRRGIWDRRMQMNTKTNLIASAVAALAPGAFSALTVFRNYGKPAGTVAAALISAVITFALCFITLTLGMKKTKKRQKELEEEPSDADELQ